MALATDLSVGASSDFLVGCNRYFSPNIPMRPEANLLLGCKSGGEPVLDVGGHVVQVLQLILFSYALLALLPVQSPVMTSRHSPLSGLTLS